MELCCLLDNETRDSLVNQIHRRLAMGAMDSGPQEDIKPLHLMSWCPPADWDLKVLRGYVDDGDVVSRGPLHDDIDAEGVELVAEIKKFVSQMRDSEAFPSEFKVPFAPLLLASIRHRSPLPPEIWRMSAFPIGSGDGCSENHS